MTQPEAKKTFVTVSASDAIEPLDLVGQCFEHGADALLLENGALPPAFFDLSSGVAGELVQKITNYQLRMAAVVPDVTRYSAPFQQFAREANAGSRFRFFRDSATAIAWLESS